MFTCFFPTNELDTLKRFSKCTDIEYLEYQLAHCTEQDRLRMIVIKSRIHELKLLDPSNDERTRRGTPHPCIDVTDLPV